MFKTIWGARRIGVGSFFWRETKFGKSFEKKKRKLIVCWNLNCLSERNE